LKRNVLMLLLVAACAVLLITTAVLNFRSRRQHPLDVAQEVQLVPKDSPNAASAAPSKDAPAGLPDGTPDLRGKVAPNFALKDLSGKTVSLKDYRGKAVLVNFWATWCAPCKVEMPWFEKLSQQYAAQGLVILGVTAEDVPRDEAAKSAQSLGVSYPILLRGDTIANDWGGLDGLPSSFYINRQGVIVDETIGLYSKDEVEAMVKRILSDAPAAPQQPASPAAKATASVAHSQQGKS
jgi:thiol-disulfide isomerase/thioredoxin